ncbi:MAG TPA: glucose 1-dehydrogenase [Bryobacteraceae bacterium]|nr:glucose 1-dehydrogenase [Bryobacteraceae bacterium]
MSDSEKALEGSRAPLEFEGRVALITGATSGIGAATAKRISELGGNVLLTGRRRVEGERLVREMNRNPGKVVFCAADLSDSRAVKTVVPAVLDAFGRLDFAFNNAGISGAKGSIVEQSEREYDLVFDINVKAMFLLLQDELRQMVAQGFGGSIVNTSSVGGTLAAPGAAPYIASKHAVLGLTRSAAVEYGRHGIRVNAVSPGAIRTELLLNVFGSQEALDQLGSSHPLSRIGLPEEVAETVVWLFSENSSYLSGQSIVLDGGLSAQRPGVGPGRTTSSLHPGIEPAQPGPYNRTQFPH